MRIRRLVVLAFSVMVCCLMAACQKSTPPAHDLPDLAIGVVGAVVPMGTTDLLAGFIPEERSLPDAKAVFAFDEGLMRTLKSQTKRLYTYIPAGEGVDPGMHRSAERSGALAYWTQVGKQAGVDLLIVPQIISWHDREGGSAGVTTSADININFYLIDVRGEGELLARCPYMEKQVGLSSNLLNLDTFIKRGGKWLTAQDLALEGVQKMIKEFGL